jgi:hypothetical protein
VHCTVREVEVWNSPMCDGKSEYCIHYRCLTDAPVEHWQVPVGPGPAEANLDAGGLHGSQCGEEGIMTELLPGRNNGVHLKRIKVSFAAV